MDFDFNDDQNAIAETVGKFLEARYTLDRHIKGFEGLDGKDDLWSELGELGVPSMLVDEAFDGQGMSFVDAALVIEQMGRVLVPISVIESLIAGFLISRHGSKAQKERWLRGLAQGAVRCAVAISENDSGYAMSDITARASRNGTGWYLSSSKILVPEAADADLFLVVAQVDTGAEPVIILLDREILSARVRRHETIDAAAATGEINLEDIKISSADFLGGDNASPHAAEELFDACANAFALYLVGISSKMLDAAVDYAKQRVQFGKPIGSFQAIKHKCADMAVLLESARSAAYYGAWAMATNSADRTKAVSMAKSYCGDAAAQICNESIQVHGGMGFTWDLGLHYYLRRAKFLEYSFGDARFHRERVVACTLKELGAGN